MQEKKKKRSNRRTRSIAYLSARNHITSVKNTFNDINTLIVHFHSELTLDGFRRLRDVTLVEVSAIMRLNTIANKQETKRRLYAIEEKQKEAEKNMLERLKNSI